MKNIPLSLGLLVILFGLSKTASAATLKLDPSSGSFATGQTFGLNIDLDTAGASIDGVDIYYLHYDPKILEIIDADSSAAGIQIKTGKLFPQTLANSVDPKAGKVVFSQVSSGGTSYKGSGVLASISFRALAAGNSNVYFDFTKGNTADTNVAGSGTDKLTSVTNAQLTISGSSVAPTTPTTTTQPESNAVEVSTSIGQSKLRIALYVIGALIVFLLLGFMLRRKSI